MASLGSNIGSFVGKLATGKLQEEVVKKATSSIKKDVLPKTKKLGQVISKVESVIDSGKVSFDDVDDDVKDIYITKKTGMTKEQLGDKIFNTVNSKKVSTDMLDDYSKKLYDIGNTNYLKKQEILNRPKINGDKTNLLEATGAGLYSGFSRLGEGLVTGVAMVGEGYQKMDEKFLGIKPKEYLTTSAKKFLAPAVAERTKIEQEFARKGDSENYKLYKDVVSALPQLAGFIASAPSAVATGVGMIGSSTAEGQQAGLSGDTAQQRGLLTGGIEAGTQALFGLGGKLLGGVIGKAAGAATGAATKVAGETVGKAVGGATKVGLSAVGEGAQEAFTDVTQQALDTLVYKLQDKIDLRQTGYAGLVGAISGGMVEGVRVGSNGAKVVIDKLKNNQEPTIAEINTAVAEVESMTGKSFADVAIQSSENIGNILRKPDQITPDTVQTTEDGQVKLPEFGTEQPNKVRKLKVPQQMELEGIKEYDLSKTPKKITNMQTKLQQEQFGLTKKQLAENRKVKQQLTVDQEALIKAEKEKIKAEKQAVIQEQYGDLTNIQMRNRGLKESRPVTETIKRNKAQKAVLEIKKKLTDSTDQLDTLNREAIKKDSNLTGNVEASAQRYRNVNGAIKRGLSGDGTINLSTLENTGEGLERVLTPVYTKYDKTTIADYMRSKDNITRESMNKGLGDTTQESQELINKIESENPDIANDVKGIYDFINRSMNDNLVSTGIMTQEQVAELSDKYKNYIPEYVQQGDKLFVLTKGGKGEQSMTEVGNPIISARGSKDKNFVDLPDALANKHSMNVRLGLKNKFMNDMFEAMSVLDPEGKVRQEAPTSDMMNSLTEDTIGINEDKSGSFFISRWKDGFKETRRVDGETMTAIQNLFTKYQETPELYNNTVGTLSKVLKGATVHYNPVTTTALGIMDFQAGIRNTRNNQLKYMKNYMKSFVDVFNPNNETKSEYLKKYDSLGLGETGLFKIAKGDIVGNKKLIHKLFDGIKQYGKNWDDVARLAEFRSSIESGKSVDQALLDAADITVNFSKGGQWTKGKVLNDVAPFFNAGIRGLTKELSLLRDAPIKTIVTGSLIGILPTLALAELYKDEEWYKKLDDRTKNNNLVFNVNDKIVKIPLDRFYGSTVGRFIKDTSNYINGDVRALDKWKSVTENPALENLAPNNPIESNLLTPVLGILKGSEGKTSLGYDIVPESLQGFSSPYQYDSNTSSLAIAIGQATGWSPKVIDYAVFDAYGGSYGQFIKDALSAEQKNTNPMIKRFITTPEESNNFDNLFYQYKSELDAKYQDLKKGSEDINGLEYRALFNDTYAKSSKITQAIKALQSEDIEKNKETIAELRKMKLDLMQNTVELYQDFQNAK